MAGCPRTVDRRRPIPRCPVERIRGGDAVSTDEAAQRLRQAAPVQRVDTWTAYSVMVSESDLRALLDERDALHARIADREALEAVVNEALDDLADWNDTHPDDLQYDAMKPVAAAVTAYLTSAPDDEART